MEINQCRNALPAVEILIVMTTTMRRGLTIPTLPLGIYHRLTLSAADSAVDSPQLEDASAMTSAHLSTTAAQTLLSW